MNQYISRSLQVDLSKVIVRFCRGMIDPQDFMQILIDPPANEEDLMDFIDRDDADRLQFVLAAVKDLTVLLSPDHLKALRWQVSLDAETDQPDVEVECDDCGGILLKSCTCEG